MILSEFNYLQQTKVVASSGALSVVAPNGDKVQTQLIPVPEEVLRVPGRKSRASHELVFRADLPPLGFKSFFVEKGKKEGWDPEQLSRVHKGGRRGAGKRRTLRNEHLSLSTGPDGLGLKSLVQRPPSGSGKASAFAIDQGFAYYDGHPGHNRNFGDRASGAYIFRPLRQSAKELAWKKATRVKGPLVQELHMEAEGGFVSQVRFKIPFAFSHLPLLPSLLFPLPPVFIFLK